ncbi:MAG: hypothetical protein KDB53_09875, partial [Planctomycetes bacterium]|nr:hypothetical protein [Planctomycetota bacterium]
MNPDDRRSLRRQLLALALPLMASNLSQSLLSLTDTLMVGHLSDERPLAALGHANVVILVIFLVMSAPFLGIQALVARRLGEGRERAAGQVATSGLVLGTLSGIAFGFAGWLFADDVAVLVAQDRDVTRLAADYLQIRWTFALPITLLWAWRGFLYGASRTRFDMGVALTVNALNVLLTWMLIWGKWGAPELGMPGAAWGSALATTTGALMMAGDSLRPSIRRRYGIYGKGQVDLKIMAAIVRLSMPRAVQAMA